MLTLKYVIKNTSVRNLSILYDSLKSLFVNVLNLHKIDLAKQQYTHLQREIEKEEEGEKE